MFERLRNKIKPKANDIFIDPRLVEKILHSDLWEFFEKRINILTGKKPDSYFGKKIPTDPIQRFFMEVNGANSGILNKETFKNSGFSEDEINVIFGTSSITLGAPPQWFIKCQIWDFMCFRERARLAFLQNDKKSALNLGKVLAEKICIDNYIDWGKSIREFWFDESMKEYHEYLLKKT